MIDKKYEDRLIDFQIKFDFYKIVTFVFLKKHCSIDDLDFYIQKNEVPFKVFYDFLNKMNFIEINEHYVKWIGKETDLANLSFMCYEAKEEIL
jgi:hypothetical protein